MDPIFFSFKNVEVHCCYTCVSLIQTVCCHAFLYRLLVYMQILYHKNYTNLCHKSESGDVKDISYPQYQNQNYYKPSAVC